MGFDDDLVLGLGFPCTEPKKPTTTVTSRPPPPEQILNFEPSLTLSLLGEPYDEKVCEELVEEKKVISNEQYPPLDHHHNLYRQDSAASSFSNSISVKRERENNNGGGGYGGDQEVEIERVNSSRASDEDEDAFNAKKKLRLTKAQSAMLEESFKHRSTLNPKQKQDLAKELKLRPRQVEVWFQNRRARTKLKQTEVDCEFLKKCCETLTEENRRLQKELQELKALKLASNPYCMQLPAATLTMCPSCERIVGAGENASSKIPFSIAPAAGKPHLFNPFAKAC